MTSRIDLTNRRQKNYKATLDSDDIRKRNHQNRFNIRKQRKEENLMKHRRIAPTDYNDLPTASEDEIRKQLQNLPKYDQLIRSNNCKDQLTGTIGLRRLLSIEVNPPIDEVISQGVVPKLVEFLDFHDLPRLQFEASWALTNIASGNSAQTFHLLKCGAVPKFVKQLMSPDLAVREQAVWALGNIAGDSFNTRDFVLAQGVMQYLIELTDAETKASLRRNAVWTISNLCRGKPVPPFNMVEPAIPTLANLLADTDTQVVTDACWALSYLSDGDNLKIQAILEAGVAPTVVHLLMHHSASVQTPALRVVGNIVTGDDFQTEAVIEHNVLDSLRYMLINNPKKGIKKEVCWTLSNITAGNQRQVQKVLDADLIQVLIFHLQNSEFDIRKEAAWAIANATSSGSSEQIEFLVSQGCIKPLCDLLHTTDPRVVAVSLEGLENILKIGEKSKAYGGTNPYVRLILDADGKHKIDGLTTHPNNSIYDKATNILEAYFSSTTEDDQNIAPNTNSDASAFTFGSGGMGNQTFNFS